MRSSFALRQQLTRSLGSLAPSQGGRSANWHHTEGSETGDQPSTQLALLRSILRVVAEDVSLLAICPQLGPGRARIGRIYVAFGLLV